MLLLLLLHVPSDLFQGGQWRCRLHADSIVMVLGVAPGPNPPRPQAEKDRPDQLAEAGRVDRLLLGLRAEKESRTYSYVGEAHLGLF